MTEFKREFFKVDPVMAKVHEILVEIHKVAYHTERELIENRHVKDFCVRSRHFVGLPGSSHLFLHYDTLSWFEEPNGVRVVIDAIGVYDDRHEFDMARYNQLNSTSRSSGNNLN